MSIRVNSAAAMQALASRLAALLAAGDLLVLSGGLGAGKTTFTQGLARGLRVSGRVTSPTFVIAREHPSLSGGPALVHVDAYRLGGIAELDDLDLDSELEHAVTVVEWGSGLAEGLSESRLEIDIDRDVSPVENPRHAAGADDTGGAGLGESGDETRLLTITPRGTGWDDRRATLEALLAAAGS